MGATCLWVSSSPRARCSNTAPLLPSQSCCPARAPVLAALLVRTETQTGQMRHLALFADLLYSPITKLKAPYQSKKNEELGVPEASSHEV